MRLYVEFEDNIIIDVIGQTVVDRHSIKPGRGSKVIRFAHQISIRKLKPRERFSHKIGDLWISSRGISLAYLLAFYMIKNKKSVLAGFFERGDGKYIFVEIKAGNASIEARHMLCLDSDPKNFMALSGKQYDGVFGDASLSMEPYYIDVPYEKLLREITTGVTPMQALAVLLAMAVIVAGVIFFFTDLSGKKKAQHQTDFKAKEVIPPLTGDDIRILSMLITKEALIKYKQFIETLPDEIALKKASFQIMPVRDTGGGEKSKQEIKGILSFQFESFYPFRESRKREGYYVFEKELVFTKHAGDVSSAQRVLEQAKINNRGFETLVDLCEVTARTEREWKFSIEERDYKNVVKVLNDIYLSQVVIDRITIQNEKTVGEMTYYRL